MQKYDTPQLVNEFLRDPQHLGEPDALDVIGHDREPARMAVDAAENGFAVACSNCAEASRYTQRSTAFTLVATFALGMNWFGTVLRT